MTDGDSAKNMFSWRQVPAGLEEQMVEGSKERAATVPASAPWKSLELMRRLMLKQRKKLKMRKGGSKQFKSLQISFHQAPCLEPNTRPLTPVFDRRCLLSKTNLRRLLSLYLDWTG